ncbi:MAG: hypothetical protein EOP04_23055 [Proteobacteria bacterium]|nr:MAG: hypothetical protein EOP04_23055 [Pseudomonadota bacterium]
MALLAGVSRSQWSMHEAVVRRLPRHAIKRLNSLKAAFLSLPKNAARPCESPLSVPQLTGLQHKNETAIKMLKAKIERLENKVALHCTMMWIIEALAVSSDEPKLQDFFRHKLPTLHTSEVSTLPELS